MLIKLSNLIHNKLKQGASKKRIAQSLTRWLGWAVPIMSIPTAGFAVNCFLYENLGDPPTDVSCLCRDASFNIVSTAAFYNKNTGEFTRDIYVDAALCADSSDTVCGVNPNDKSPIADGDTIYVKNTSAGATDYYACTFEINVGFSSISPYTPFTPVTPVTAPINNPTFTLLVGAGLAGVGAAILRRRRLGLKDKKKG